ncbi:uncharacterized protein LOC103716016 [Phoenix dactylifera]|uniref:Uncharacterized protein LOC103716016 n=1 Tax=Phoenix dactylifera TaxID=42345 RepID=A0A8B9AP49_PHODC|nr:uncharacterized protein LOC103716016 [Phoenix dactylifera]
MKRRVISRNSGVTEQLCNFIKGFSIDTFKTFPLQDDRPVDFVFGSAPSTATNVRKELTEWQERHATLVLSKVKEIAQLRYILCPRHLKEKQFWRIYFLLVKSYVASYEMRAIQKEKIKMMGMDNEKAVNRTMVEVEMIDAKNGSSSKPLGSNIGRDEGKSAEPTGLAAGKIWDIM